MKTDYTSGYTGVENLEVLKLAKKYNHYLLQEVLRNISPSPYSSSPLGPLVDFGAGMGTFSQMVRDQGFQVECIEYDQNLRAGLSSQGFKAYQDLSSYPAQTLSYVFSLNVLEHIENHQEILHDIFRALRPGGVLYLYVPAFNLIYSSMDKKVGHFRRYTKSSLLPLLEKAGFVIDQAYYVDSLGFLASLIYKYLGDKGGDLSEGSVRIYDRFLFPLSLFCDLFCKNFFGKNLAIRAIHGGLSETRTRTPCGTRP
jgi:SAM-dependent methyltransferase